MNHTTAQLQLAEQRVQNEGPNIVVAYLLWAFLGLFSAHRFYLNRANTAVLQILSYFVLFGVFWWLIDAALIPGMIRQEQAQLREQLLSQTPAEPAPASPPQAENGHLDKLQKLWDLKQSGALSESEYEAQKAKLL